MDQMGDPMEMNLDNFQVEKWISQTVRAQIVDKKNWVICLVSFFPSWVLVLQLPKIMDFLKIFSGLSKKFKCIKAVYL